MRIKNPASNPNASTETDRFLIGCGFFVFALTALWAAFFVPMNMDEAGIYHWLACTAYPFASLHTFREACTARSDLWTPFGLHIAHSEFYTGLWHNILYAPFYFLFHAPGAQYAFGLCFLAGFAALAARMTAKPLLSFAIILSFFPFVFQFMHDVGPVAYAMFVFPLGAYFLKKLLNAPSPAGYGYAVILVFLVLTAVEEKPFFLYLLPSAILFALALAAEDKSYDAFLALLKNARGRLATTAIVSAIGLLLLFFSTNQAGQYYVFWLAALAQKPLSVGDWLAAFLDFIFYWPYYAHYFMDLAGDSVTPILFGLGTAVFFAFCFIAAIGSDFRRIYPTLRLRLLGLSFASSGIIFFILRNTWGGHHFVFLWAPLIVLFADLAAALPPRVALIAVAALFALDLTSVSALTQEPMQVKNASEREAIFAFFNDDARAAQSIYNFSSWGGFYIQALYGPNNQLVTYTEPYDQDASNNVPLMPQDAQRLLALAKATGRTIYNACYGSTCYKTALEGVYGSTVDVEDALPGLPHWHVFAVTPSAPRARAP